MEMQNRVFRALSLADSGVEFENRTARCPVCGWKMQVVSSGPKAALRVRSHRCRNPECLLAALGVTVKSVEGERRPRLDRAKKSE